MSVPAVAGVVARINEIQQRFAPAPGIGNAEPPGRTAFAAALRDAGASAGATGPGAQALRSPLGAAATSPLGQSPQLGASALPDGPSPAWAARLPEAGRRWAPAIQAAADEAGVDAPLLAALVWAESGFRADAGSHAGAIGLSQLMPGTARGLGVDPHDPESNLLGGARYLRAQLDRFGSIDLALAAYNAGPGRVAQAGGIPRIAETQAYVPKVLGHYSTLRS